MNGQYDLVGDVHGMRETLSALLGDLGYVRRGRSWSHDQARSLVFVGDLLDRGPDPLGCLELAEDLVTDGVARMILGNHELNALHFMSDPPLRRHSAKNIDQFKTTLAQIELDRTRWDRARAFLSTCPLSLELDGGRLRVVHACWDHDQVMQLPQRLDTADLVRETAQGGALYGAVEHCLKGPEARCEPFTDEEGHRREARRTPWWSEYADETALVVFGHYWFPWKGNGSQHTVQDPGFLGPSRNAVCIDYSAGRGGRLVALRYPERTFVVQDCLDVRSG